MPKVLRVRALTNAERQTVERLARSRTEPARLVERARIVWASPVGDRVPAIAVQLHLTEATVRLWISRFTVQGVAGLQDEARPGRPATYTAEQVSEAIATALTKPDRLGLPFGSWTLDRLEVYLNEEKGIPIKRSRIDELLIAEGLRWRSHESWFGERAAVAPPVAAGTLTAVATPAAAGTLTAEKPIDPEFAQKRGRSPNSIPLRPQRV